MCLYSRNKEPLIADKDIPCYKTLIRESSGVYISPVQEMEYIIGDFNYPLNEPKEPILDDYNAIMFGSTVYIVGDGYLHCYTDVNKSEEFFKNIKENQDLYNVGRLCVFECYIPKGSKYFISDCGKEICSDKLFVKDIKNLCLI